MSILITQYPGQLNLANSNMLWEITSSFTGSSQYQYILAFQDGCGTTATTVKQQPNPSGLGLFNMGRIAPQYLTFDTEQFNMGADGLFYKNQNTAKFFKVAFGEEYTNNYIGSAVVYNGITNATTGSPAQTGSISYYYFLNGTLDPNSGDWNWNTSSYYSPQTTPSSATFFKNVCLTNAPRSRCHLSRLLCPCSLARFQGRCGLRSAFRGWLHPCLRLHCPERVLRRSC